MFIDIFGIDSIIGMSLIGDLRGTQIWFIKYHQNQNNNEILDRLS